MRNVFYISIAISLVIVVAVLAHYQWRARQLTEPHQDYWASIVTEGPHAGLTRAEAQRKINSELKEWKAELEQMLEWYQGMGDEIKRDNVRIEAALARSKAENDAVLADHPATPLTLRLIKEGYTDEEIARHPEFIRLMTEYLGMDYLSTDE